MFFEVTTIKIRKVFLLAALLGCLVTSTAMAKKPSMRSVKNLFVKHTSGFKQWGVNIVAGGLLGACVLTTAGCVPVRHDHPGHIRIAEQGGVRWHVHTTSAYEQHGRHQHKGLIYSFAQRENYLENFPTLTPSAYHEATVLFDDDGVFRSGLATSGESDDTIVILFPHSQKHQTIHLSQIVGVQYMHTGKPNVNVSRQDMHPFGYAPGMYESDPSALHHLIIYRGKLIASFTNGMGIVELSFDKRALAEVDKNISAPAR